MKIFISYRRAEDNKSYIVGTIHEKLARVFGEKNIFRDTYDISGGADWRAVLGREINNCKVMLVIIGPDWANLTSPNGQKRLFDPNDVTRWEVETGLRLSREEKTTVIPVLVTGAGVPRQEELPDSLHPLLEKNVIHLRNFPDFDSDMEKLIRDIRSSQGFREDDITIEPFEPKTIYIAEGSFWMGSDAGEGIPISETPRHEVTLPAYRICKYPVTNTQYEYFVRQTRSGVSDAMRWKGQVPPKGQGQQPVLGVTLIQAIRYCEWLSQATKRRYALPNEAQWEKACQGAYEGMSFTGSFLEWTCSLWGKDRNKFDPTYGYPWKDDGRNDLRANFQIRRVMRGGTTGDEVNPSQCSARRGRSSDDPGTADIPHGFRVVLELE